MTETKGDVRRVTILVDTETHMMPALAREMARRDHHLVIANVADGLVDELTGLGAEVEVVPGELDLSQAGSVQKLVDAATARFGQFDRRASGPGRTAREPSSKRPLRTANSCTRATSSRSSWRCRSCCPRSWHKAPGRS